MRLSLYIHIPFCVKKCLYCDFASSADATVSHDEYIAAVVREMEHRSRTLSEPCSAETIYLGGGTPSLIEPGLVGQLIEAANRHYNLVDDSEITLEANPATLSADSLAGYRSVGVNRLSIGVQSLDDAMLARLGRIHTAKEATEAVSLARSAGFDNIGIDLIHSLPGQSLSHWKQTLSDALTLEPQHISAYGLTIEEDTPFGLLLGQGKLEIPDSDESATMYETTMDMLTGAGFEQYEIANFALAGKRSQHNQVYWRRGNYLGFGAGAHSFMTEPGFGQRWGNLAAIGEYCSAGSINEHSEQLINLTKRDAMGEALFLGLRLMEGVDGKRFSDEFGISINEAFPGVLEQYLANGLLAINGDRITLTRKGILLSNQLFAEFA